MSSWQFQILKIYLLLKRRFSKQSGELDIATERADVEAMTKMFKPLSRVEYSPIEANGVAAEWIVPPNVLAQRVILFLHGGSFNSGSITSHRCLAANVAWAGRARALLTDYRLAPEHPFPAAVEDAIAAYEWLLSNSSTPNQVAVAGDSAGGTLALALLVHLRDQGKPLPAMAVCLSAPTDLTFSGESWTTNAKKDFMLDPRKERKSVDIYLRGTDPCAPLASPLYADLRGFPPLLLQVGSDECLLSDSTRFAERAKTAGVEVSLEVWEAMQHEWQFAANFLPEGRQAITRVGEFMEAAYSKAAMSL
jgi:monoterpene epsilon-lactone hydrolase